MNTDLFHAVEGSGTPILFMHGGLGWDHTLFRPWLDPLTDDYRLIFYDHRGNGRSPRPTDWSQLDHATWVADADHLRAELGLDRMFLFGHSYGGFLALEYALRNPDRLLGLILCGTAPVMDYPEVVGRNAQERATPEQMATVQEVFSGPVADDASFERIVRTIAPLYYHRPEALDLCAIYDGVLWSGQAFNRAFYGCVAEYDVLARLCDIHVPALVLGGRHDWIMPPAEATERLHRGLPQAAVQMFEQSGHFPWIEESESFVSTIRWWLGEQRQA